MLRRIMRHERSNLIADRTLLLVTLLFAIIIGYGVYNGALWVSFQNTTLAAAQRDEAQRYDQLKAETSAIESGTMQPGAFTDPRSPAVVGGSRGTRYAIMPPAPLAALSVGQSDLYPYYFKVSRQSKQTFIANDEIENPTNLLSGKFDLAFAVIFLYPLLILALSYNLISAEKEQGTLQMMMSQPVALKSFVLGKVCSRAGVVLALAVGLSFVGFLLGGVELTSASVWWRFGMWGAVVAAYGGFWFALAVIVNAFGKSSATNAMTLAGLWLVFVLIIPSLFNVAVTTVYQVPSRVEMIQAMRRASTEAGNRGSQLLAKYYNDHPELVPAGGKPDLNDFYTRSIAVQEETERAIQPVMEHFDRQVMGQQSLVNRFRFISPAVVAQAALNDLAGTSAARYRHFLSLVDDYHRRWLQHFNPRILKGTKMTVADYDQTPVFNFSEEAAESVLGRVLIGLLGILAPTALIAWLALVKLRRYPLTA